MELEGWLRGRLTPNTGRVLREFGKALEAGAKATVPVDTGALQRSITFVGNESADVSGDGELTLTGTLRMLYYGGIVLEGAGPHDIPNAFGRGPHFGFGLPYGRPDAFHPGQSANDFLTRIAGTAEMAEFQANLATYLFAKE